jgi:hypothetical protein
MAALYVRELFGLLRYLGIEQQRVADAVGPNKHQISYWAHGHRPVPKRKREAFLRFVTDAITSQRRTLEAVPPPSVPATLITLTPAQAFDLAISRHVERWRLECQQAIGDIARTHAAAVRTQQRYQHLDPAKLTVEELEAYLRASHGVSRILRDTLRLKTGADEIGGRLLTAQYGGTPEEEIWRIAAQATGAASQEEEPREDDDVVSDGEPGRPG